MLRLAAALAAALLAVPAAAAPAKAAPKLAADTGEPAFRALYKELVETNTAVSAPGGCTLAAQRVAARMKAAGFTDAELTLFSVPEFPLDGGLVAVLPGKDPKAKAVLLLAHLDVVEAKREDWTRDPFTLVEENGYFYARGASDDKAQAAIFADLLIRLRREGYQPKRAVKMALTCGEESGARFNGAEWLAKNRRDLIDAGVALNEGAGASYDRTGKRISVEVLAAEKATVNFTFEVTNPGGHSSRPVPDNAIYDLARALDRVSHYEFPLQLNDANRAYFTAMAKIEGGETGAAMTALLANPQDAAADARLSRNPDYHTMLRTTCVATTIEGGHATNALPQRARANINCRVFPGVDPQSVRDALVKAVANPTVTVSAPMVRRPPAPAPPMSPQVLGPIQTVPNQLWPGVPVIPFLLPGATDANWLNAVGIPTFGVSGLFDEPGGNGAHGLNEHILVKSVMEGREFTYRLVRLYAEQK
jgi:acetylornithine deacetylase/succinyl-diaminopimelate desuccinylase-like protein